MQIYLLFLLIIIVFFLILWIRKKKKMIENLKLTTPCRYLCIYVYYQKNSSYKQNFKYFLRNGILPNVDYFIIINGKCNVSIPRRRNITVFYRPNKGFDFGAYSYALARVKRDYDYYFFINTSLRGPIVKHPKKPWIDEVLSLFSEKNVHLVGISINVYPSTTFGKYDLEKLYGHKPPYTHVQSMMFCMTPELLQSLQNEKFFDESEMNQMTDIEQVVAKKEIGLSQHVLQKKWNLNCLLPQYRGRDYVNLENDINYSSNGGDPWYKNAYFGKTISVDESMFLKTNRL